MRRRCSKLQVVPQYVGTYIPASAEEAILVDVDADPLQLGMHIQLPQGGRVCLKSPAMSETCLLLLGNEEGAV